MTKLDTDSLRLDIWLWHARFFKTRALSGKTIAKRGVRITRMDKIHRTKKPSASVFISDILTFSQGSHIQTVEVLALGSRRGPAVEARKLYEDIGETSDV